MESSFEGVGSNELNAIWESLASGNSHEATSSRRCCPLQNLRQSPTNSATTSCYCPFGPMDGTRALVVMPYKPTVYGDHDGPEVLIDAVPLGDHLNLRGHSHGIQIGGGVSGRGGELHLGHFTEGQSSRWLRGQGLGQRPGAPGSPRGSGAQPPCPVGWVGCNTAASVVGKTRKSAYGPMRSSMTPAASRRGKRPRGATGPRSCIEGVFFNMVSSLRELWRMRW